MPIGTILPYIGDLSKIPHGWFLCDGNNGTPDLRDRFLQGSAVPGQFIEAGLPNLVGSLNRALFNVDGKLFKNMYPIYKAIQDIPKDYITAHDIEFNAHSYNAIYKDECNTVQPPAYTVYYIMRIL